MRKWKVWLLIVVGILGSLVAWALVGRNVWEATTARVRSAAPGSAIQERARNNVCSCDTSGHKVSFVTVEPGVQLEVLDWGGTGDTLVLLPGRVLRRTWNRYEVLLPPLHVTMDTESRLQRYVT